MSRITPILLASLLLFFFISACHKRTGGPDDFELSREPFGFPSGLPIPADVKRTIPELGGEGVRFETNLTPAEIANYYRQEIVRTGLREDSSSVQTDHALSLVFRGWPGRRVLSVKASRITNRSNVLIRLGHSEAP